MSLAVKSLNAVKSHYAGTVIRVSAQLGSHILIMRELGPELIGTFGYVFLLYGLLSLLIDQGFGWSLIQSDFNNHKELAVVFTRIMLGSLLGMIFVFFISFPMADVLNNDLVGEVFRYSAPSCLAIGMFIISISKLRADLRFKEIQIATSGAYVIAFPIIGVMMVLNGYGIWALLAAWYAQAIIQAAIAFHYSPHSLKLENPFCPTTSGKLGRHVASINILNWAVDGSAGILVGRLSAAALGNLNAAMMLTRTPTLHLVQTLQTILFSTACIIRDDRPLLKRLYLSSLATISFIVVPGFVYANTHADLIIHLLFGEKWKDIGGLFSALSLGMIALSFSTLSGSILTAVGDQKTVLYSQVVCLILIFFGVYVTATMSLFHVGVAVAIAYWVRLLFHMKAITRMGEIASHELIRVLGGPIIVGTLIAIPASSLVDSELSMAMTESISLLLKFIVLSLLCKIFPNFFFCPALVDVLNRFTVGRNIIRWLGVNK
jgi:O-antigen/teichoic acid export membrane protein